VQKKKKKVSQFLRLFLDQLICDTNRHQQEVPQVAVAPTSLQEVVLGYQQQLDITYKMSEPVIHGSFAPPKVRTY
jgi:hypothetical protein